MTRQVSKTNPTLEYISSVIQQTVMSSLNCNNIGRIVKFYPETFTADVELMQQKQFYNTNYAAPYLVDVPVIVIGGTNSGITMPDYEGCYCHLAFMDRNIDAWYETGEAYAPDDARMHDFSDAIALVGLHSLQNPVTNYEQGAMNLWNISGANQGQITIKPDAIQINTSVDSNPTSEINVNYLDTNITASQITNNAKSINVNGNLNVENGISAVIPCGGITLSFSNGILTGVN